MKSIRREARHPSPTDSSGRPTERPSHDPYERPRLAQLGDLRGETLGTSGGYGESGVNVDSHYQ